jgi:hypothetical protein
MASSKDTTYSYIVPGTPPNKSQTEHKKNAFDILMSHAERKSPAKTPKSTLSRRTPIKAKKTPAKATCTSTKKNIAFVLCPLGCGRHIPNLQHKISQHLDTQCSTLQPRPQPEAQPQLQVNVQVQVQGKKEQASRISTTIKPKDDYEKEDPQRGAAPQASEAATVAHNDNDVAMNDTLAENDAPSGTTSTTSTTFLIDDNAFTVHTSLVSPEATQHDDSQASITESQSQKAHASLHKYPPPSPVQPTTSNNKNQNQNSKPQQDVFAHMMQQSSKVFAKQITKEIHQHLSLQYDAANQSFALNLDTDASPEHSVYELAPFWSCTTQLKDKSASTAIQLTVSITIVNETTNTTTTTTTTTTQKKEHFRWVRQHSRLSVPVLKSILQKSIRRRRPLPSVRVAMEIVDKALGPLLRRLPIIMLEDSTLHPDFGHVVWMMLAHSKGFFDSEEPMSTTHWNLILALQLHLLRIVYQVASCPVQDLAVVGERNEGKRNESFSPPQPCLSNPFPPVVHSNETKKESTGKAPTEPTGTRPNSDESSSHDPIKKQLQMAIWAMLVRAKYGGMSCDVRMLESFAQVWHERLLLDADKGTNEWTSLPDKVHGSAMSLSAASRLPSTEMFLDKLRFADICKEGVDFHCSNIIGTLLEDPHVKTRSQEIIRGTASMDEKALLRGCIWKYSAGVNLRRARVAPLSQPKNPTPTPPTKGSRNQARETHHMDMSGPNQPLTSEGEATKALWKDVLSPCVGAYQTKYINERLCG